MRTLLLASAIALLSFKNNSAKNISFSDSTIIHVLDGKADEWPSLKFETDADTKIKYAVDNDAQNLYVAMLVPSFPTEAKMIRQGMNLYIDVKGKRKENKSIEFPVKSEDGFNSFSNTSNRSSQDNGQQKTFDKQAFRSSMGLNLLALKLSGFSDAEPVKQGISEEGTVNIQFNWDASDVMCIEYRIPLSLLGDAASLNQKQISVGWKINGVEMNQPISTTQTLEGRSNGRTVSRQPAGNSNANQQISFDNRMKEQSFWTKYTVVMPSK